MEALDRRLVVVVRRVVLDDARGAERVGKLRGAALAALAEAARASGARLGKLEHDGLGAPLPSGGWHWSIAHTSWGDLGLAAASVSRSPVGVDAEAIRAPGAAGGGPGADTVAHVLSPAERALFRGCDDAVAFAGAWTAKEAVLKKLGLGLTELSSARIDDVAGELRVVLHAGARHAVESREFAPFLVAVAGRARESVDWRSDDAGLREALP